MWIMPRRVTALGSSVLALCMSCSSCPGHDLMESYAVSISPSIRTSWVPRRTGSSRRARSSWRLIGNSYKRHAKQDWCYRYFLRPSADNSGDIPLMTRRGLRVLMPRLKKWHRYLRTALEGRNDRLRHPLAAIRPRRGSPRCGSLPSIDALVSDGDFVVGCMVTTGPAMRVSLSSGHPCMYPPASTGMDCPGDGAVFSAGQ